MTLHRDVIALDGEGMDTPEGDHLYTLLLARDNHPALGGKYPNGRTISIENYAEGLNTEQCLEFLLRLRKRRSTIVCAYYFNYDVTMWIKGGLSDAEKTTLWRSGWLVWRSATDRRLCYYLRYIPGKIFFVGEYRAGMGTALDLYHWDGRSCLVYDVSGFAQTSFIKAIKEWDVSEDVAAIAAMKQRRGSFTERDADEVRAYCRSECIALCEYVTKLDSTFQEEGITLQSWHGGGALASWFLKRERVAERVRDATDAGAYQATVASYFGGRNEIAQMGHLTNVLDYDIASAYPAASLCVPDLVSGVWDHADVYDSDAPYALWHCRWDTRTSGRVLGPLPFRYKKGVYFPHVGEGWVHACELSTVTKHFGGVGEHFWIDRGEVFHLADSAGTVVSPFEFVRELAGRRVAYKRLEYRRSVPYKYGLNSIYGKLAQHAVDAEKDPPYRCYYAAGLITAITRAMLLELVYANGMDDRDVVMFATDGVFCRRARTWHVSEQERLGYFGAAKVLRDGYFIQPGCWYSGDGRVRSRGYGAKSLDYPRIKDAWDRDGIHGHLTFHETRFVGLGTCAGTRNFDRYGCWLDEDRYPEESKRHLTFYPNRKVVGLGGDGDWVQLHPPEFPGLESEPYVPASLRDDRYAVAHLDELLALLHAEDQPDME
jgi:hypothetical protein